MTLNEKIEMLVTNDRRYDVEAYLFLRDALEKALKKRKNRKKASQHVGAEELLDAFRLHALKEYGPMALTVLSYWGVHSCEDVGHLVFNLVEAGVFGKTDEDTMDSFRAGYNFEQAFAAPFRPAVAVAKQL